MGITESLDIAEVRRCIARGKNAKEGKAPTKDLARLGLAVIFAYRDEKDEPPTTTQLGERYLSVVGLVASMSPHSLNQKNRKIKAALETVDDALEDGAPEALEVTSIIEKLDPFSNVPTHASLIIKLAMADRLGEPAVGELQHMAIR